MIYLNNFNQPVFDYYSSDSEDETMDDTLSMEVDFDTSYDSFQDYQSSEHSSSN